MCDRLPERRRTARLSPTVYGDPSYAVHVTVCTAARSCALQDPTTAGVVIDELRQATTRWGSTLYCYCVMPDHVHVILTPGRKARGDLSRIVGSWKAAVTRAVGSGGVRRPIWQRSFWDHVLRREEDLRAACEYIVANPVRKGLAARWEEWPFSWINPEA